MSSSPPPPPVWHPDYLVKHFTTETIHTTLRRYMETHVSEETGFPHGMFTLFDGSRPARGEPFNTDINARVHVRLRLCYGEQERVWKDMIQRVIDFMADKYERQVDVVLDRGEEASCAVSMTFHCNHRGETSEDENVDANFELCDGILRAHEVSGKEMPLGWTSEYTKLRGY